MLTALFDRHGGTVGNLAAFDPMTLGRIVLHAYEERDRLPPPADPEREDVGNDRFNKAGGAALAALVETPSAASHGQLLWLSRQKAVGDSAHRLRELAYEMAERLAERPAWTAGATLCFEQCLLAPIGNGDDLLDLALDLIDAVNIDFRQADMSARSVVATAQDEAAVQDWLGAELKLRGRDRFHVHREAHVAQEKRPDLILASSNSPDEVAIEVKHGAMNWSYPALRKALAEQLAEQYLLPANRRHGILVISHHRDTRFWRSAEQRSRMCFAEVIERLQREAATITANSAGAIRVAVRGILAASTDADRAAMLPAPGPAGPAEAPIA